MLELTGPVNGVHYVVSGGGGGPEKAYELTDNDEMTFGFTGGGFVGGVLSAAELRLEFFDVLGVLRHRYVISR